MGCGGCGHRYQPLGARPINTTIRTRYRVSALKRAAVASPPPQPTPKVEEPKPEEKPVEIKQITSGAPSEIIK